MTTVEETRIGEDTMLLAVIGVMSAVSMSLMVLGAVSDWLAARSQRIDATRTIEA